MGVYLGKEPVSVYSGGMPVSTPYTAGNGINIDDSKVVSLKLAEETNGLSVTELGLTIDVVTSSKPGVMAAEDKVNLDKVNTWYEGINTSTSAAPKVYGNTEYYDDMYFPSTAWTSVETTEKWSLEGYYKLNIEDAQFTTTDSGKLTSIDFDNDLVSIAPADSTSYQWCLDHVLSIAPEALVDEGSRNKTLITNAKPEEDLYFKLEVQRRY